MLSEDKSILLAEASSITVHRASAPLFPKQPSTEQAENESKVLSPILPASFIRNKKQNSSVILPVSSMASVPISDPSAAVRGLILSRWVTWKREHGDTACQPTLLFNSRLARNTSLVLKAGRRLTKEGIPLVFGGIWKRSCSFLLLGSHWEIVF